MAVQAPYPSNAHLFIINNNNNNRSEQETKEMDYTQNPSAFFSNATVMNGNQARKRAREFQMAPTPQMNLAQLQQQQQQHQTHPPPPTTPNLVSTGLRLSFPDIAYQSQFTEASLAFIINQHKDEIERYLTAQGEQLRRTLAEKRQRHYSALLGAAEESAARRLREKEAELSQAARRAAELEECIGRLRAETMTWQAKAMTEQATAASLHAQIQLVPAATKPGEFASGGDVSDAESAAHVDRPDRDGVSVGKACRVCGVSAVSVVVLPCRHLCMCAACDEGVGVGDGADAVCCPVCHAVRTGSVQVFFS